MEIISKKDAQLKGLKFFFTGQVCLHGHIDKRKVKGGQCHTCVRNYAEKYRKENSEKVRARIDAWHKNNRERRNALQKIWYENNKDKHLEAGRKWAEKNREKHNAKKQEYRTKRRKKDKTLNEIEAVISRNRRAKKKNNGGTHTVEDIKTILLNQNYLCNHPWCQKLIKDDYRVDHIVPLKLGGSNAPHNLQILCDPCNARKHATHPIAYAARMGYTCELILDSPILPAVRYVRNPEQKIAS